MSPVKFLCWFAVLRLDTQISVTLGKIMHFAVIQMRLNISFVKVVCGFLSVLSFLDFSFKSVPTVQVQIPSSIMRNSLSYYLTNVLQLFCFSLHLSNFSYFYQI